MNAECLKCGRLSKAGKNCMYCDEFVPHIQPTNDELHEAWAAAIHAQGIPGAYGEAMQNLRVLRERRTTWFGERENNLRKSLDNYLKRFLPPQKESAR